MTKNPAPSAIYTNRFDSSIDVDIKRDIARTNKIAIYPMIFFIVSSAVFIIIGG